MPTHVRNARKVFGYRVEVAGLGNQFEVQKCSIPELSIDQVEHGDSNTLIKTAGMLKVGNIKMEKLKRIPGSEIFGWEWLMECQNFLGGGLPSEVYYRIMIIRELGPSGIIPLNTWVCEGCWPCKMSQTDFSRKDSENVIQTIEFSVNSVFLQ